MCSSRFCRWPRLWTPLCRSRTPAAQTILHGGWMTAVLHQNNWCLLQCICYWGTRPRAGPVDHTGYGGWTSCGHRRSSLLWCSDQSLWKAGSCYVPEKKICDIISTRGWGARGNKIKVWRDRPQLTCKYKWSGKSQTSRDLIRLDKWIVTFRVNWPCIITINCHVNNWRAESWGLQIN